MLFACVTSLVAGTLAPLPMIRSKEDLKSWAIEQVVSGNLGLGSTSLLTGADNVTDVYVSGSGADEVLAKLSSARFRFRVAEPKDGVYVYGSLTNSGGDQLFYGNGYGGIDSSGVDWKLLETNVKFSLSSSIAIPVPFTDEVSEIYLIYRDESGNYQWSESLGYSQWNKTFYFPTEFAGKDGQLIFRLGNAKGGVKSSVAYSLKGVPLASPQIVAGLTTSIDNYASYDSTTGFTGGVLMNAVGGYGHTAPIVKVKVVTQTSLSLVCRVLHEYSGATLEVPASGKYRKQGTSDVLNWQRQAAGPDLVVPPGTYYIWWDTSTFETEPTPPYYGGGGKG
ncbi:MAG: hypothetical protein RLY57_525 [Candidatus Parcubacteria bacterium]